MLYQRISVPSSLPPPPVIFSIGSFFFSSSIATFSFLLFFFLFFLFFIYIYYLDKFQGFEQIGERWVKGELKVRQRGGDTGEEKKKKKKRVAKKYYSTSRGKVLNVSSLLFIRVLYATSFFFFFLFFENRKQNFQFVIRLRETPGFYLIRRSILHRIFFWYRLNTDRVALVAGSSSICNGVSCSIMFDKRMLP